MSRDPEVLDLLSIEALRDTPDMQRAWNGTVRACHEFSVVANELAEAPQLQMEARILERDLKAFMERLARWRDGEGSWL